MTAAEQTSGEGSNIGVVAVVVETLRQILADERLRIRYRQARQLQRAMPEME